MATRRMFSKVITDSARFLRMPATSRLLYYDLGMQADDDGVVEAFTVIRTTGASEDDLRVLATKGFITVLNEDLVSFINDWKVNNLIKNDRYHPSVYADLLVRLTDGTQEEPDWNQSGTHMEPERNPSGLHNGTQNDFLVSNSGTRLEPQVRLGKDSIGKVSLAEFSQEQSSVAEEMGGMEGRTLVKEKQPVYGEDDFGSVQLIYQHENKRPMPDTLLQACFDSDKTVEELKEILYECRGLGEQTDQCIMNRL